MIKGWDIGVSSMKIGERGKVSKVDEFDHNLDYFSFFFLLFIKKYSY